MIKPWVFKGEALFKHMVKYRSIKLGEEESVPVSYLTVDIYAAQA